MKVKNQKNDAIFYCARIILFVALVLRFLIPQGFMIDNKANSDGHIRIVLCKSQGNEIATLDLNSADHDSDKQKNQNMEHCNFVGFNAAMDLQATNISFEAPFFDKTIISADKINVYIGNGLAAPPPPSTGPPTIA